MGVAQGPVCLLRLCERRNQTGTTKPNGEQGLESKPLSSVGGPRGASADEVRVIRVIVSTGTGKSWSKRRHAALQAERGRVQSFLSQR